MDLFEEEDCNQNDDLISSGTPTEEMINENFDFKQNSPFQKEIIFNKLLPYADKLDDEADILLAKVKANLGRSVMLRKIKPDCLVWSNMLHKYMILYDLRFTKEDHITFIKLMYELVTIPNLESSLIGVFGYRLYLLLRKVDLITPDELELPWRPLYNLFMQVMPKPLQISLYHYPSNLRNLLESIICVAKCYFPLTATQEILDELRPKICPFNIPTMPIVIKSFELFLPLQLSEQYSSLGYELWFDEFMKLWQVCSSNSHTWAGSMMQLMAKLACNNIGYIDWEPYIPLMFTRFVQSFHLPVYYKKIAYQTISYKVGSNGISLWISSVLGGQSSAQSYLDKFLKTVETYFHPANYGHWLKKLGQLFVNILYCVVIRINRERNTWKPTWKKPIPEFYKLTDSDIDAFVSSMMPIIELGIFNKRCSQIFYIALHHLAIMRPNVVIPKILEKVYPTLNSEIEPHKLITSLNCMVSISRPLVQGSRIPDKAYAFHEGPQHVLPILFTSLSGIDPNDLNKCMATFNLIATYVTMVPIADCSKTTAELTEEEREVCAETSRFEDFVLQFMDKVFVWIDSSSVETVRLENQTDGNGKSRSEAMAETALSRVFLTLLEQCSHSIFVSALNKLKSFIVEHVLETQVAGQMVATLCKVFTAVDSHETMKALFPFLSEKVLDAIGEGDEVIKAEHLDNQLLYPLLLLNRLVATQGHVLTLYMDTLFKVIDKAVTLKSREGNLLGCFIMNNVLMSLSSSAHITDDRNLDDPQYPYIKDWGQTVKIAEVKLKFTMPGPDDYAVLQVVFERYFMPAVAAIENYIKTGNSLSREELQVTLRVIYNVIDGCDSALPFWSEPPLIVQSHDICLEPFDPITLITRGNIKMPDGGNVRTYLVNLMTKLQEIMSENVEDDTKSLTILQLIWQNLLLARVSGQHQIRRMCRTPVFTETHKTILMNIMKLSTSQYSRIRSKAQDMIQIALGYFPNVYPVLLPYITNILQKDPTVHHDAYKGILYLLVQRINRQEPLLVKPDWEFLKTLWPVLVLSQPSEKPSVIRLKDVIIDIVVECFYTTNLKLEIPDSCVSIAANFWNSKMNIPDAPLPKEEEVKEGIIELKKDGEKNLKAYGEIVDILFKLLLEKNLHWRHRIMAINFLYILIHPEQVFPPQVLRYFLRSLINESIDERKLAVRTIMYLLKQIKRKYAKINIEIPMSTSSNIQPGYRSDNAWLQYNYENRPIDSTSWDQLRYVHKNDVGYYVWPQELLVYAPSSEKSHFDHNNLTAHEREVYEFFNDQQNVDKLMKYLSLEGAKGRSLKFNNGRMFLFKYLFRNHGDAFLDKFLLHLENFVADKKQESAQVCAAEIICGLISGSKHWPYEMSERTWIRLLPIIRKALSNLTVETINDWTVGITLSTKDRDPNKLYWLLECLMEESPLGQAEASFRECGRLTILQGALVSLSWRVEELLHRLLLHTEKRLEENPLQNVRERVASILSTIFRSKLKFGDETVIAGRPDFNANQFIDKIFPRLQSLLEEDSLVSMKKEIRETHSPKKTDEQLVQTLQTVHDSKLKLSSEISVVSQPNLDSSKLQSLMENLSIVGELKGDNASSSLAVDDKMLQMQIKSDILVDTNSTQNTSVELLTPPNGTDEKREKNIRLLKTVCRWILEMVMISGLDSLSSFYRVYPIMAQLESNDKDEGLSMACTHSMAVLAGTLTLPEHVPSVLDAIRTVSQSASWSARASCLDFMQVLVFNNMSILLSDRDWIKDIEKIVLKLLEDERLEVRQKAGQLLGGLLHCTILPDQELLLEEFKKKAKTKLGRKKKGSSNDKEELAENAKMFNAVRLRHAGVLGMCAFVQAHPYDIPKHIPPIFECLSFNLNDPEPIPATIRKTLNDFKRTHCDGWTGLQGLAEHFTEEQFALMQDLTVPPSYYA
ncbi:proteasome activator complex subunit 4-like isoform X2 [Phymastichus coffea]|uniref:proteasome activator complex subunit 4-like isoform X2 n=1 Tax=Phymastichus coffea TaxID=108790 RepID=UPI00273C4DFA|nr:proteasome activator complex subunit 4-like isoform X2 [Phymastichus coffea]